MPDLCYSSIVQYNRQRTGIHVFVSMKSMQLSFVNTVAVCDGNEVIK